MESSSARVILIRPEILTAAIQGFEFQKTSIDGKIAQLRAMLSGGPAESAAAPETPKRKRRKMSGAGRARIAEAQRKGWAAPKPKRKLSAAGRAAIVAATKKRWRLQKAAAKAAAKKAAPAQKKVGVKKAAKKTPGQTAAVTSLEPM